MGPPVFAEPRPGLSVRDEVFEPLSEGINVPLGYEHIAEAGADRFTKGPVVGGYKGQSVCHCFEQYDTLALHIAVTGLDTWV